ncbi:hydroxysqualene dehydroxylase HpnE [Planctomicrobium sp. SH668]|uniref:hydroxysqualene dehydroxylase HpnE n=1 Tax=Planctomicrobium sp. SH668 TaxID=3448126 RepID=UPI003F5C6C47
MAQQTSFDESSRVVVVGGGLAGIAAAVRLAQNHLPVTLLESRQFLGGRATSYTDVESGTTIDNCQHVSMGCCTNLRHLCKTLGLADILQTEQTLYFICPHGNCTPFSADPLPAPLHLTRGFWNLPYLSFRDKLSFATCVRKLATSRRDDLRGQNFEQWLRDQRQSDHLIRNVWEVVLVSALSESLDRIDAAYAHKVFVDGFLLNTEGWKVEVPQIKLDELYSDRTANWLQQAGVTIHRQARVTSIDIRNDFVHSVQLPSGEQFGGSDFIIAVPHHQLTGILPEIPALTPLIDQASRIETAPITSVHLWFDRAITSLPHAVLLERMGQWMFNRGPATTPAGPGFLYQVVISASRNLATLRQTDVTDAVTQELKAIWPESREARLIHSRMITERRAVFSAVPGIDQFRPAQQSAISNLQVAGDWTQTGWPSTMEGAVRSGYLAAANVLEKRGIQVNRVEPDLPNDWLARLLWRIR